MAESERSARSLFFGGVVMILVAGATLLTALALENGALAVVFYGIAAALVLFGFASIGRAVRARSTR